MSYITELLQGALENREEYLTDLEYWLPLRMEQLDYVNTNIAIVKSEILQLKIELDKHTKGQDE